MPKVRRGGFVLEMIKGSNVALTDLSDNVGSVIVSLGWASPTGEGDADVSVLLLDADGKVRSDSDFYFYNHPVAVDGSVQLLGKTPTVDGSEDRISFDLTAVPSEIDRVVVAASRYEGARFGELEDVRITLADAAGESLLRFAVDDAGAVTAVIFGELYRRGRNGSSVPSGRATKRVLPGWLRTSGSISRMTRPRTRKEHSTAPTAKSRRTRWVRRRPRSRPGRRPSRPSLLLVGLRARSLGRKSRPLALAPPRKR